MTRGPIRLDVAVGYAVPRRGLPSAVSFRKWVAAALAGRIREADLAIRLVGTREGRALNRHYRGRDYATNVLSFPADLPEGLPPGIRLPLLGDLVLRAPRCLRLAQHRRRAQHQVAEQRHPDPGRPGAERAGGAARGAGTAQTGSRPLRPPHRARGA